MINQNISGLKPAFIFLLLLFFLSACGDDRNQGTVFDWGVAGRADADSLLFMQYTERLGYHYGVRSDSVLWYGMRGTQGTGLGLIITTDIVKAHGGDMEIESEPGTTVFRIRIPS